jgi:hypothetical protein
VRIARGDGLIAHFGDVVTYIADTAAAADRLLTAIEAVAHLEHPAGEISGRLATIAFGADSHRITPFGVVTATGDALRVILRGPVTARCEGTGSAQTFCGSCSLTWVDEILPASVQEIAVMSAGGPQPLECPRTDLRDGVVPGGGFVLHRRAGGQPTTTAKSLAPRVTPAVDDPTQRVVGSSRRASPETSTLGLVSAVLASPDGAMYPLDRPYVIGRNPLADDAVRNATASPIVVHNDNNTSRVHAYIWMDRGVVFVRDASTPAGTFIAAPGAKDWTRIGPAPTQLEPGWSLRIGEHILTYVAGDRN